MKNTEFALKVLKVKKAELKELENSPRLKEEPTLKTKFIDSTNSLDFTIDFLQLINTITDLTIEDGWIFSSGIENGRYRAMLSHIYQGTHHFNDLTDLKEFVEKNKNKDKY